VTELLGHADVREAASVLGRAFRDNPGIAAVLKGESPERRERLVGNAMVALARATLQIGQASVIKQEGQIVAVSLVLPPRAYPLPLWIDALVLWSLLRSPPKHWVRFARLDARMRKRHVREPHFYLWVLGVDPEHQGRGHGSALLRMLDAQADAAATPCYLETDKPSSVRLYQRHGYDVRSEERVPVLDFQFWFMLRPKPGA